MTLYQTETTPVDPAELAALRARVAELEAALVRIRNLGEAAGMVNGKTIAGIARTALEGKV